MSKFIINRQSIHEQTITFSPEDTYHIAVVLRKQPGDSLECLDEHGTYYSCILTDIGDTTAHAEILMRTFQNTRRHAPPIYLLLPILKKRHTEFLLQKGTEMGVDYFIPWLYKRNIAKIDITTRRERLEKIIQESCKQCERPQAPSLLAPLGAPAELNKLNIPEKRLSILLWEKEKRVYIKELLRGIHGKPEAIILAIGPEGGISEEEVTDFRNHGFLSAGLGPQIMRSETAVLFSIAVCLYEYY